MTAKLDRLKKTEEEGIKRLQEVRKAQAERKKREDETENTWEQPLFEGEKVQITRKLEEPSPLSVDEENNLVSEKKKKKKRQMGQSISNHFEISE